MIKQYEYTRVVDISEADANKLGKEGWEPYAVTTKEIAKSFYNTFHFRREIIQSNIIEGKVINTYGNTAQTLTSILEPLWQQGYAIKAHTHSQLILEKEKK